MPGTSDSMTEQDLIGKIVRIVGIDTGGGAGQSDFVSHIALDIEDGDWRGRVFVQATDPSDTWEIKFDRRYDLEAN